MTVSRHQVQPADAKVEQWLDELDPATTRSYDAAPHRRIIAARRALVDAQDELSKAVAEARAIGYSWAMVGASLGVSRQAAQQRFDDAREVASGSGHLPVPLLSRRTQMAKNSKETSTKAATAAGKVLRDGRTSKSSKTAAGSALSQKGKTAAKKK